MTTVRAVVLADTHMRAGGRRQLPEAVYGLLEGADIILHAGDVIDDSLLMTLRSIAPTWAVLGNNDLALAGMLPDRCRLDLGGLPVALTHDAGARQGRAARMRRRFPDAAVVIFGHSHIPCDELGDGHQRLFNPGSPTERRSQAHHTAGVLEVADGRLVDHRIVIVDPQ